MLEDMIFFKKEQEYGISPLPGDITEAMAYIPYQNADKIYSPEHGINAGTMFKCLDKPFKGCLEEERYL